ncbi:MAG: hypothetical protein K2X32_02070 [Phycisphaerales bacterium]|nr:hypothetical protein [Phycisphaerales bacterium]
MNCGVIAKRVSAPMACALMALAGTATADAQFTKFKLLDNEGFEFIAPHAMSADGTTVVGIGLDSALFSPQIAFRHRFDGTTQRLGVVAGSQFSTADAVDASGLIVVGSQNSGGFRWVSPGPGQPFGTQRLVDISSNGAVTLSRSAHRVGNAAATVIPVPPTYTEVSATRVAGENSNLVAIDARKFIPGNGYGYPPTPDIDFTRAGARDIGANVSYDFGVLSGGESSRSLGISADGTVVVGVSEQLVAPGTIVERAFRATVPGSSMVSLGTLSDPQSASSTALDVSRDGAVIVGQSNNKAFVWTSALGMRSIQDVLIANGQDLQGWSLSSAFAVSDDGTVVAGTATRDGAISAAWAASLTFTCTPPASAGDVVLTTVAVQGETPPGAGAPFSSAIFGVDVSATGRVLFSGPLTSGTQGVYVDDLNVAPALVISAPPGAPVPLGKRVAPDGRVLVLESGASGIERYRLGPPAALADLLVQGATLPGTGGGVFLPSTQVQADALINDATGLVGLQAGISGSTAGQAAFVTSGGPLERVFLDLVGQGTALDNIRLFGVTETGALARAGDLQPSGTPALLIGGPPPSATRLVVKIGDAVPGQAPEFTFTGLQDPSAAGTHIDFHAFFGNGLISRRGIFRASSAGIVPLLNEGDSIPGVGVVESIQTGPTTLIAASAAETLFTAFVAAPGGLQTKVLLRHTSAGIERVLSVGDVLPGAVCREITSLDLLAAESGRCLVSVTTPSVAGSSLYVVSAQGLSKVVEPGQTISVAPFGDVTVTSATSIATGRAPGSSSGGNASGLRDRFVVVNAVVNAGGSARRVILRAELPGVSVTRCSPADIADDQGTALPPNGNGGIAPAVNNGVTEGDYNLFFSQYFEAGVACDIADDTGQALPPFGNGGIPPFVNNGVTEGDYNLFFAVYFNGCP